MVCLAVMPLCSGVLCLLAPALCRLRSFLLQCEAIPESLKNMLLVMHTAGILQSSEAEQSQLWRLTWDRIDTFLPKLKEDVFKPHHSGA